MGDAARKQAIDAYKNRPLNAGVFAVRCSTAGSVWVGSNTDLDAARNALWFLLRSGRQRNPSLQAAWTTHGDTVFSFDILERIDPKLAPAEVGDELKRRLRHWSGHLGAEILLR